MEEQTKIIVKSLYKDKDKPWRFKLMFPVKVRLSDNTILVIPAGYITDFASVPRMLKGIINSVGNHNLAVLVHDYLYDTQDSRGRKFADNEMLFLLKKEGCSKIKQLCMYVAVRLGGRSWWRRNTYAETIVP